MAMATRLRVKKATENAEPVKLMEGKVQAAKALIDAKEKRRAFGDINSRFATANPTQEGKDKQPLITAVYKDVKPRVDSRWKKADAVASRPKLAATVSMPIAVQPKPVPLLKQTTRPQLVRAVETTMPLKRSTSINKPTAVEVRKDSGKKNVQESFIRSPGKILRKEKSQLVDHKLYPDTHSTRLLHQIENIDEKDLGNTQMVCEYVNDIYQYLFKLELYYPIHEAFLHKQVDVTPKMRSVLLDWINEVHNQFSLEIETYHLTVSMIDRYLQLNSTTPRRYLQLVGVTCLFIASKYEELMPPEISDFVYVTDDTYTKEQILDMEKKIFRTLGYNLSKPLPIHFLRRFAKAADPLGDRQYMAAKYFMELASIDYELTHIKPSKIAAASLYLALYVFNTIKSNEDLWTDRLEYYSTFRPDELMPVVKRLATLAATAKDVKLKSVFTKYSHTLYKFTSVLPEMTGIKMHEIINRE